MLCIENTFTINTHIHSKSKPMQASITVKHGIPNTEEGITKRGTQILLVLKEGSNTYY